MPQANPACQLRRREQAFLAGHWPELLRHGAAAATPAPRDAARPSEGNVANGAEAEDVDLRRRSERAAALAHLGELSAAAKALTALPLAPTSQETLAALRDPLRRPPEPQIPVDPELCRNSMRPVELCRDRLITNVRKARKGAAAGPSGCTGEHLRVLLDDEDCAQLLTHAARKLASGQVPAAIIPALRLGRMVALSKPTGGVRALVMGDAFRRVVARTLAQQYGDEFQRACAPFQYALSTKAGAETLQRLVRAATERDPRTTVLSVDGVGAYDHISRHSMLAAIAARPELSDILPYAALFYGSPSTYLFYDAQGTAHEVRQGEGGEQGDPLMPALFALGQHAALTAVQARLRSTDQLFAFLDDVYVTGPPEHTANQFHIVREALLRHANIRVHLGKTRAWNSAGEEPPGLLAALPPEDPANPCWTGSWALPASQQGIVVLGSPIGSRAFIADKLAQKLLEHDRLLQRIPHVPHLQSAWLLLLYCAAPRCVYLLRTLAPTDTADFAAQHDTAVRSCLATLLAGGGDTGTMPELSARRAQLPLRLGGLGLGSAERQRYAAYWASWADTLQVLRDRQPGVLAELVRPLLDVEAAGTPASTRAAAQAAEYLRAQGFRAPSWATLLESDFEAPPGRREPGIGRPGWQHAATTATDKRVLETLFSDLDPASRALLLSQSGDAASCAFTAFPTSRDTDVPDAEYRILLLRRLRLPLPLTPARCPCGGNLDALGDHRSACAQVGVLARRAGPLERAAARICREAGARVATNVSLRDLNLDLPAADGRRIEVVANNLPIWQGAQIAVDTTIVSPLKRDGEPRPQADREPGLALRQAVDRKLRAYPELRCARRCKLVVFGVELGGRFSQSTLTFLRLLARARARQRAPWCAAAARQAMVHRWTTLAALAALRAHACTLLELPVGEPVDPLDDA